MAGAKPRVESIIVDREGVLELVEHDHRRRRVLGLRLRRPESRQALLAAQRILVVVFRGHLERDRTERLAGGTGQLGLAGAGRSEQQEVDARARRFEALPQVTVQQCDLAGRIRKVRELQLGGWRAAEQCIEEVVGHQRLTGPQLAADAAPDRTGEVDPLHQAVMSACGIDQDR